ncbi:TraK domain-containing protein [Rosenbergiella collisarenosi]|uniref:TraK domain-containing protein n=1 Tax=Rosenbergiella collisarenosi TaxID=1544695 RepID=UPI001F4EDD21|nr:type-F conjugative transfer system secretin TraK [Rosenbergiella collisarenosi]
MKKITKKLIPLIIISAISTATQAAYVAGAQPIMFGNDALVHAVFSKVSPNRVIVQGEKIVGVDGPDGAYEVQKTADGGALVSLAQGIDQNFTLYIVTDKNSALSIDVVPRNIPGKTLSFVPNDPPMKAKTDTPNWEEGQSYEKTLIDISKNILNGVIPQDFSEYPISRDLPYHPNVPVNIKGDKQFVGPHLRIVRYVLTNPSYLSVQLTEKMFYQPGVRAVMLSNRNLYSQGQGYLFVIYNFDSGSKE